MNQQIEGFDLLKLQLLEQERQRKILSGEIRLRPEPAPLEVIQPAPELRKR